MNYHGKVQHLAVRGEAYDLAVLTADVDDRPRLRQQPVGTLGMDNEPRMSVLSAMAEGT